MRGPEKEIRPEANGADSTKISGQAIYSQDTNPHGQTRPDAPTWDAIVLASTEGQAAGYELGYAHGFRAGFEAAQEAAQGRRWAAQVARAGVEAIDTLNARRKADERARQIAARWSA